MAKVSYTILDAKINSIPENETYSPSDLRLIDSFQINNTFDVDNNFIEAHFYSQNNEKLYSLYDYKLPLQGDNFDVDDGTANQLTIKPDEIAVQEGFTSVDLKMVFHFLDDVYAEGKEKETFYIQDISSDRTELVLYTDNLSTQDIKNLTVDIKEDLLSDGYFEELYLNLGENDLLIVTNIDSYEFDGKCGVAIKLYEPLPSKFKKKDVGELVEKISDSIAVTIDTEVEDAEEELFPRLRQANFDVELDIQSSTPTEYFDYNSLFSYTSENSNREIFSLIQENSVDINIDYGNYENFINFSSAEERLKNFRYKIRLLETYQSSLDSVNSITVTNITGSSNNYDKLIEGVVNNFDHYERHLYYSSGSSSWPKSTNAKPHINLHSTSSEAVTWYGQQLTSASNYDTSNYDLLSAALPSFIAEDSNNSSGVLFVHMIGQHFDNLWIYSKAITDKYNNDNRLNVGISKDLVQETLKSFGIKLHNSIDSSNNLFKYLIGETYDSGSVEEVVNNFITVSGVPSDAQPIAIKNYEGEVYKRIYHNLPFLMKTKGTQRGLRALINCFGIPSDFLKIKQYGGQVIGSSKFVGEANEKSTSRDKIYVETRASGSAGKVLSRDTSIQKKEIDRTKDIHRIEVGFSPSDSVNTYILSQLSNSFNIDDYIGDPRDLNKSSYNDLFKIAHSTLHANVERAQLNDFVRILKFYDNVLFKMVKDFIPSRATLDTGIIIKPHILNRSKIKSPDISGTRPEYSASIDTAFTTGSQAGVYDERSIEYTTSHSLEIRTKTGSVFKPIIDESPMLNGELDGAYIEVTDGELNDQNVFKQVNVPFINYDIVNRDAGSGANYLPFSLSTDNTSSVAEDACLGGFNTFATKYHNGAGEIPAVGDFVFGGINDATGFNGGGNWWIAKKSDTSTYALRISGSGNLGYVGTVTACSGFDNVPPTGYKATWNLATGNIIANNASAAGFKIFDAEIGTTYNVTASLELTPNSKVTSTGTVTGTGLAGTPTDFSGTINCAALADGANVLLDVTLVDAAGNRGGLAPTGTNLGNSLTASLKDTSTPSGYSVRFTTSNFSTNQTVNSDGNFRFKVENLPSNDAGVIYYTLTSTGGGTYSSSTIWNTSLSTSANISVHNTSHSLGNGTVTVTLRAKDTAGNEGAAATDTVSYSNVSGTMSVLYSYNNLDVPWFGGQFWVSVDVTPNASSWSMIDNASWVSISNASNYGDDGGVLITVGANYTNGPRIASVDLKSSGGSTLDTLGIIQDANCVAPETLILMADGTQKRAGDLEVGDVVKTKHDRSLEEMSVPIIQKVVYQSKRLKVVIGDKEIVCSTKHRFYVDNKLDFVSADELEDGDILSGKAFISSEEYENGEVVKLTVERAATYIAEGILSHNIK